MTSVDIAIKKLIEKLEKEARPDSFKDKSEDDNHIITNNKSSPSWKISTWLKSW